ncbi:hypothetical protein [Flavivirga sp. 57AJ16]|uniref:hypothetical protein n=1 Tax=Flavivirga sp. 57AJ16 TaxID=3025307 RepID=UPI002366461A|nr:hypothetical protein [Flavivirga sp. 57AJ16]MDD7886046.1 hypothetical protein [Flavivirga sp. 57AJ16]
MRKTAIILSLSLFIGLRLNAQTNTFPTSGNVGIGTTTPSEKLVVEGNIRLGLPHTLYNGDHLSVSSTWGNWMTFLDAYSNDTYNFHNPNNGGRLELYINDGQANTNKFGVFTVLKSGNIGIGTSSPTFAKLQISGGYTHQLLAVNRPNSNVPALYLGNDGSNDAAIASNNSHLTFGRDLGGSYTEYMRIENSTGNVGIGTTDTKGYKLGVQGKIAAEEVKVALHANWADFVFENNYKLPTLKEVEQHIKEKGHLQDIPSAEEVAKNGIFLGEMDAKLLQKIEELTLYTIAQEKKIKKQSSKIKKQEQEIMELKSLNEKLFELQIRLEKLESKK